MGRLILFRNGRRFHIGLFKAADDGKVWLCVDDPLFRVANSVEAPELLGLPVETSDEAMINAAEPLIAEILAMPMSVETPKLEKAILGEGNLMDWNRLAEIEQRAAKATEGMWSSHGVRFSGPDGMIGECGFGVRDDQEMVDCAAFIAHSRSDIPWLCQKLREALSAELANTAPIAAEPIEKGDLLALNDDGSVRPL